jgi:hypothetical protein
LRKQQVAIRRDKSISMVEVMKWMQKQRRWWWRWWVEVVVVVEHVSRNL